MNEYRLGNLVNDNYTVIEIDANGLGLVDANLPDDLASYIYVEYENIKPIPLTEDWILKFGFEYSGEGFYRKDAFSIEHDSDITANDTIDLWFGNKYIKEIKYVHQLQNIYFALTNKELCTHDQ